MPSHIHLPCSNPSSSSPTHTPVSVFLIIHSVFIPASITRSLLDCYVAMLFLCFCLHQTSLVPEPQPVPVPTRLPSYLQAFVSSLHLPSCLPLPVASILWQYDLVRMDPADLTFSVEEHLKTTTFTVFRCAADMPPAQSRKTQLCKSILCCPGFSCRNCCLAWQTFMINSASATTF